MEQRATAMTERIILLVASITYASYRFKADTVIRKTLDDDAAKVADKNVYWRCAVQDVLFPTGIHAD